MMLDAVVTEVEKLMANPDLTDAEKEALETALDALKEQMPKSVLSPTSSGYCPKCDGTVLAFNDYCKHRGQALDWK